MSTLDLDAIEARAASVTVMSMAGAAELIKCDVPALVAALRERDNTITRVREVLERNENSAPDDWGLTYVYTSQLRAALDPQETP
ncbi:hypothetical protein ACFULT_26495 [Rhodococcus sp. NPDC057297]|uniref:hypothetical protein n=1 Tax=Rhodococcus sp. NPDC057297 TaxID=3346090 RepID=UPI003632B670